MNPPRPASSVSTGLLPDEEDRSDPRSCDSEADAPFISSDDDVKATQPSRSFGFLGESPSFRLLGAIFGKPPPQSVRFPAGGRSSALFRPYRISPSISGVCKQ
jgi:hypothetical protein